MHSTEQSDRIRPNRFLSVSSSGKLMQPTFTQVAHGLHRLLPVQTVRNLRKRRFRHVRLGCLPCPNCCRWTFAAQGHKQEAFSTVRAHHVSLSEEAVTFRDFSAHWQNCCRNTRASHQRREARAHSPSVSGRRPTVSAQLANCEAHLCTSPAA